MERWSSEWRAVCRGCVGFFVALMMTAPAGAAIKVLSNDGFIGVGSVTCQTGFVAGESAAAKLTADPGDYPYQILKIRMLICPVSASRNIILRISEDNTGTVQPGPMIYEEIVQITGSDNALNELDLSLLGIVITSGSVRVELEWYDPPSPLGLAHDEDGTITHHVNYIFALPLPGMWFFAEDLLVTGDWIIRMEIETDAETPIFADGFETGDTTEWSDTTP